jgi:hypothetical protein
MPRVSDDERALSDARWAIDRAAHAEGKDTLAHGELEARPIQSGSHRRAPAVASYDAHHSSTVDRGRAYNPRYDD